MTRNGFCLGCTISKVRQFQPDVISVCHLNSSFDHWTLWGSWLMGLLVPEVKSMAFGYSPSLPFTEGAIDLTRPECRYADSKLPLNRNPVPLVPSAVFVGAAPGTMKCRYG